MGHAGLEVKKRVKRRLGRKDLTKESLGHPNQSNKVESLAVCNEALIPLREFSVLLESRVELDQAHRYASTTNNSTTTI